MVSQRCKMFVADELNSMGLKFLHVELGMVEMLQYISVEQRIMLKEDLMKSGLELMDDKKSILTERIRNVIIEMIHKKDELPEINYSEYLSKALSHNYTYLSNIFSEVTGSNIQHYIILLKIEKVKELLLYDELNLTEISYRMGYSSVAHLSNQFKKITGLTPSFYKLLKRKREYNLENM